MKRGKDRHEVGLLRRLAGACIVCGVSAMMLLFGAGLSIWTAGATGCLTAMAGADVAIGLYEPLGGQAAGPERGRALKA